MASERYFEILLARATKHVFGAQYKLVAQQLTLPSGRIDLLLQHRNGTKHVIEVKKDRAKADVVDQVIRYVLDFRQQGAERVQGWVVANEIPEQTATYARQKHVRTLAIPEYKYAAIMAASGVSEEELLGQRIQAGTLIGGGVQSFQKNSVPLETAICELDPELRRFVMHASEVGAFEFNSGKMQIAVIYKGVKIGGINRGHKHNFVSSNIVLDKHDQKVLSENGFIRVTKTQKNSSHTHVYWKNSISEVTKFLTVLEHFSKSIERRLYAA